MLQELTESKPVQAITQALNTPSSGEEGTVTQATEEQTSKLPSLVWMGLAAGSLVCSVGMRLSNKQSEYSTVVGMLAPCFLIMGIYNKLVKLEHAGAKRSN